MLSAKQARQSTAKQETVIKENVDEMIDYLEGSIMEQARRGYFTYKTQIQERQKGKVLDIVTAELEKEGFSVKVSDGSPLANRGEYIEISWKEQA